VSNGEFMAGDKRANKTVSTRNYELFRTSDLQEWYELRVEPILAWKNFGNAIVGGHCRVYSI